MGEKVRERRRNGEQRHSGIFSTPQWSQAIRRGERETERERVGVTEVIHREMKKTGVRQKKIKER